MPTDSPVSTEKSSVSRSTRSASMGNVGCCESPGGVVASLSVAGGSLVEDAGPPCEAVAAAVDLETVSEPAGAALIEVGLAPLVVECALLEASPRDAPAINEVSAAVCFEVFVPRDCFPWMESSVLTGILASASDVDVY